MLALVEDGERIRRRAGRRSSAPRGTPGIRQRTSRPIVRVWSRSHPLRGVPQRIGAGAGRGAVARADCGVGQPRRRGRRWRGPRADLGAYPAPPVTDDAQTLHALVLRALAEDLGDGDVTSQATVPTGTRAVATITQKAAGVVFGLDAAEATFRELDPDVVLERLGPEGEWRDPPAPVLRVTGDARALLGAERTALNFLQRLSGVATLTARCVRGDRGHGRDDPRHAQDDAGAARAGEGRRARGRRRQPPRRPLRHGAHQGEPRRARRRRRRGRARRARGLPGPAAGGRVQHARAEVREALEAQRAAHPARQHEPRRAARRRRPRSPGAPSSRRRAASSSTRSGPTPRPA